MGIIARLPQPLIAHLRSSSIVPDVPQAVEELVCNSLDAGSKTVCASVDLASFYIKIEDDGFGITRDDLALVGERHATSKIHDLEDLETSVSTLGFRGEALSALSDVSIVEITSRVRGSPNTYKKIIKGCQKLSMGLCSEQRSPGTTVTLREFFHNLPVRRKSILSSSRKILQAVKERIIRVALIHPDVSFTVFDSDRCEKLLQMQKCASSLDTLSDLFGKWVCSELQEIHFEKSTLILQGFVSKKSSRFQSTKALQFFYLNGRFVHKTPVHKLINLSFLANNSSDDTGRVAKDLLSPEILVESPSHQAFPAFLMELKCPLSWYDITFEPAKTSVEFKSWESVLSFVEEALETIWGSPKIKLDDRDSTHMVQNQPDGSKKAISRKRKPWQLVDPTYQPRAKIMYSIPEEEMACNTTSFAPGSNCRDTFLKMSKGHRSPRKQKACFGALCNRQSFQSPLALTWNLRSCTEKENAWEDVAIVEHRDIIGGNESELLEKKNLWQMRQHAYFPKNNSIGQAESMSESWRSDSANLLSEDTLKRPLFDLCNPSVVDVPLRLDLSSPRISISEMSLECQQPWQSLGRPLSQDYNAHGDMESDETFEQAWPSLIQRGFSEIKANVRRRLYDLDLIKPRIGDDFFCHSERKTVSNFELRQRDDIEEYVDILHAETDNQRGYFPTNLQSECVGEVRTRYLGCHHVPLLGDAIGDNPSFQDKVTLWQNCEPKLRMCPDFDTAKDLSSNSSSLQCLQFDCQKKRNGSMTVKKTLMEQDISRHQLQRTLSGPPFYKPRQRYAVYEASTSYALTNGHCVLEKGERLNIHNSSTALSRCPLPNNQISKHCFSSFANNSGNDSLPKTNQRQITNVTVAQKCDEEDENLHHSPSPEICEEHMTAIELYKEWRNPCIRDNEQCILDLTSASLGPHNKHFTPDSISKDALGSARVLQQIGKKFIATIASDILVMIDQHAADERVRLEQLRKEVFEKKRHLSTPLDYPEELSVTTGDVELLQNYRFQIEEWGWHVKVLSDRKVLKETSRNMEMQVGNSVAIVTAVPNILGERLTAHNVLLDFLRQLAKTDGTSVPPRAVLKLLANRACRGAIMFGDFLLKSECEQLIEALKRTALSLQCAHGRPTLVPIVNLAILRQRLCRLESRNGKIYHGLQWHRPTLERAKMRLNHAEWMQSDGT